MERLERRREVVPERDVAERVEVEAVAREAQVGQPAFPQLPGGVGAREPRAAADLRRLDVEVPQRGPRF